MGFSLIHQPWGTQSMETSIYHHTFPAPEVSGCAMPEPVPVGPNERELLWKKREVRAAAMAHGGFPLVSS